MTPQGVQHSMQSMYNKHVDRLLLRPEIDMFVQALMDKYGNVQLELITKTGVDGVGDIQVTKQAQTDGRVAGQCILSEFVALQLVAHCPGEKKPIVVWDNKYKHSNRGVRPLRKNIFIQL